MSTAHSYPVIFEEGEDGWIVVRCPSFQGCISQGKNMEEARANIREAIELCLEEAEDEGNEIPTPIWITVGQVEVSR